MKKLLAIGFIVTMSFAFVKAQTFTNEDLVVNIGTGFGTSFWVGAYYRMWYPPVGISVEKGIYEKVGPGYIGVGGYFGLAGAKFRYPGTSYGWNYTYINFGPRGTYHLDLNEVMKSSDFDKFDIYAGIQPTITLVRAAEYGDVGYYEANTSADFTPGIFFGSRYYFSEKFAAFTELGYNISYFTFGLSLKI